MQIYEPAITTANDGVPVEEMNIFVKNVLSVLS